MKSSEDFNKSYVRNLSGWYVLLLASFAGALLAFGYITHEVLLEKEEAADHRLFALLSPLVSPQLTDIMNYISYCASSTFLQFGYGIIALTFLVSKNWKRAIEVGVVGLGGYAISYLMKFSFHRVRPSDPLAEPLENSSFPSGHAASAFIFYGLLIYLVSKTRMRKLYKYTVYATLTIFALLIGFSRIYLRMHYPTDVAAGFCIGLAWLLLSVLLMEKMKKKAGKNEHRFPQ
jgi:undecaprenyl-diphosphatase